MRAWRLLLPLALSMITSHNAEWITFIYRYSAHNHFKVLEDLPKYEIPCSNIATSSISGCDTAYRIPSSEIILQSSLQELLLAIGVGVLSGSSEWSCTGRDGPIKFHQTGSMPGSGGLRDGVNLYQYGVLSTSVCTGDVLIALQKDKKSTKDRAGWKWGRLTIGTTAVISSYKTLNDFFASYIRAFLGIVTLVFLLTIAAQFSGTTNGLYVIRYGLALLSIHFAASSSIFDFLIPNSFGIGLTILMASGTAGCALIAFGLLEHFIDRTLVKNCRLISAALLAVLLVIYSIAGGRPYPYIQASLSAIMLLIALLCRAPAMSIFSALFCADVASLSGLLHGFPRNTSVHFLLFNFIFESFEWIYLNNYFLVQTNRAQMDLALRFLLGTIAKRFGLGRLSVSVFTKDHKFRTYVLKGEGDILFNESEKVTNISAAIMTARSPALRIRTGSQEAARLKGQDRTLNKKLGSEFCVFPLIHAEKVVGTLNITSYSATSISDPMQLELFRSLIIRLLSRIAEAYYRQDLSPNIDEQKSILEIESTFSALQDKTKTSFTESLNAIAGSIDCRIIISHALPVESRMETFSSHNYCKEDEKFLELHSARLRESAIASPANIAFRRQEIIYVDDIPRMFAVYPDFLVTLFRRNETKSLIVSPVYLHSKPSIPWGVIWIEFPNRLNRPESDLRDLGTFATHSIARQLVAHLENETGKRLNTELSMFVPDRVVQKIKAGMSPREEEVGYLLNIDLSGSTALAKELGDRKYSDFISRLNVDLQNALIEFGFQMQMIIWDAFIFTRPTGAGVVSEEMAIEILEAINATIVSRPVSFRAVLHFGNITRDITSASGNRSWTISGAALAESCKMEATLKGKKRVLLISAACQLAFDRKNKEFESMDKIIEVPIDSTTAVAS